MSARGASLCTHITGLPVLYTVHGTGKQFSRVHATRSGGVVLEGSPMGGHDFDCYLLLWVGSRPL